MLTIEWYNTQSNVMINMFAHPKTKQLLEKTSQYTLVDPNVPQFYFYQCTEQLEHEEFSSSQYLKSDFQFSPSIGQMEGAHFCLKVVCSG